MLNTQDLTKLKYLDASSLHGRGVPVLPFLNDEREWEYWHPTPGGLVKLKATPVHGDYLAKTPESETDLYLKFLDFAFKRLDWNIVGRLVKAIGDDFHNLATSLAKIDFFFDAWRTSYRASGDPPEVSLFVATEIEYVFAVCRSVCDLLQEMISELRDTIDFCDKSLKKRRLPRSFGDMVLRYDQTAKSERPYTPEELVVKKSIPVEWATVYCEVATFFQVLRRHRDRFVHGGTTFKELFVTDRGFAVHKDTKPFCEFGVWREDDLLPNNLASLRPALGFLVLKTIEICERFAVMLEHTIKWPPDLAPGYRLFIRGFHNAALLRAGQSISGEAWWE